MGKAAAPYVIVETPDESPQQNDEISDMHLLLHLQSVD